MTEVRQVDFSDPGLLKWSLDLLCLQSDSVLHPNLFTYCRCEGREDMKNVQV